MWKEFVESLYVGISSFVMVKAHTSCICLRRHFSVSIANVGIVHYFPGCLALMLVFFFLFFSPLFKLPHGTSHVTSVPWAVSLGCFAPSLIPFLFSSCPRISRRRILRGRECTCSSFFFGFETSCRRFFPSVGSLYILLFNSFYTA